MIWAHCPNTHRRCEAYERVRTCSRLCEGSYIHARGIRCTLGALQGSGERAGWAARRAADTSVQGSTGEWTGSSEQLQMAYRACIVQMNM